LAVNSFARPNLLAAGKPACSRQVTKDDKNLPAACLPVGRAGRLQMMISHARQPYGGKPMLAEALIVFS